MSKLIELQGSPDFYRTSPLHIQLNCETAFEALMPATYIFERVCIGTHTDRLSTGNYVLYMIHAVSTDPAIDGHLVPITMDQLTRWAPHAAQHLHEPGLHWHLYGQYEHKLYIMIV